MTVCEEFDKECEKRYDKECVIRVCEIRVCKLRVCDEVCVIKVILRVCDYEWVIKNVR